MITPNPYKTTYGELLNTDKLKSRILSYLPHVDVSKLQYEYVNESNVKVIFITGCNDYERELPVWDHPYVFKTIYNEDMIAVDLRKYVKSTDDYPDTISEIAKDLSVISHIVLRAMLTADAVGDVFGIHRSLFRDASLAFSVWMTGVVNNIIPLGPEEKLHAEIILAYYYNLTLHSTDALAELDESIKSRVTTSKFSIGASTKVSRKVLEGVTPKTPDMHAMLDYIKLVLPESKQRFITTESIALGTSNMWYGSGGAETVLMAIEHPPTWIALIYAAVSLKSYKRNRLSTILTMNKKLINAKEIEKLLTNYIKSYTLEI